MCFCALGQCVVRNITCPRQRRGEARRTFTTVTDNGMNGNTDDENVRVTVLGAQKGLTLRNDAETIADQRTPPL